MGQTLSAPVLAKQTDSDGDQRYAYAISEMQGWRVSMEDAHTALLKLKDVAEGQEADAFFAVYDGHGGASVAKYAGENVCKRLGNEESYLAKDYPQALKRSFLGTDDDLRADPSFFRDPSGCTAVAALITHDKRIFVANAGDSRSVLSNAGTATPLSFDHKPDSAEECTRIQAAGGFIESGRVCGNLALTRAIGDFEFKKEYSLEPEAQIITSNPDITEHQITEDDEFLILACDGIWDCLTSQQVINFVRRFLQRRKTLPEICEAIMDHCVSPDPNGGIGMDNMTFLIVAILNGRTLEQWYDWMADRVEKGVGFATPEELPQVYSPSRLMMATERQRRLRERNASGNGYDDDDEDDRPRLGVGPLGGLARIFAGTGAETFGFIPGGGIGLSRATSALFRDDSSDEESDEDISKWSVDPDDERFQEADDDEDRQMLIDDEGSNLNEDTESETSANLRGPFAGNHTQGEAPPPPKSPNPEETGEPVQLNHIPLGDEPNPSIQVESHVEGSEDPIRMANAVEA